MKFGVREICDVVFKAKADVTVGNTAFSAGEPVLYIDTAKTSTLEGAATTVYAQGGKGNSRLIAWEGEKTLTFTVEDAVLSPLGFSVLSGAGLLDAEVGEPIIVHFTADVQQPTAGTTITLTATELGFPDGCTLSDDTNASLYATVIDEAGAAVEFLGDVTASTNEFATGDATGTFTFSSSVAENAYVRIDGYIEKTANAQELQIDAENFAGYYYVEASTLFRDQGTGLDLPAEIVIPKAKIQSNFTFNMAATGDPSTFTFTMDAFPAPTKFSGAKKVLAVIQIIDSTA